MVLIISKDIKCGLFDVPRLRLPRFFVPCGSESWTTRFIEAQIPTLAADDLK